MKKSINMIFHDIDRENSNFQKEPKQALTKVTKEVRIYIKRQTIYLRQQGKKHQEIADILNINPGSVANIISDYNHKGNLIFQEDVRGRKTGEKRRLSPEQEKEIQEIINTRKPENEGVASSLWNRPALSQLIKQKYNIDMPLRSITNYLKRWHMSLQRPAQKNYKQDPLKVDEFKNGTYPKIVRKAVTEHAEIMFVDETGINNQEYRIRGYSPVGITSAIINRNKYTEEKIFFSAQLKLSEMIFLIPKLFSFLMTEVIFISDF